MKAHEAKALMRSAQQEKVRSLPLQRALALIKEAADKGDPGVNFMYPQRPNDKDPLAGLGNDLKEMLAIELTKLGYTVSNKGPGSDDQRDTGTFLVTWGEAPQPRGPEYLADPVERCPHCKQPWEGDLA